MKDLYVYFSESEYFNEFTSMNAFDPAYEYNLVQFQKLHSEEYGRLNLPGYHIHLIFDVGKEMKCPWCAHDKPTIQHIKNDVGHYDFLYAECPQCLARGPQLKVSSLPMLNDKVVSHYKYFVLSRWANRIAKKIKLEE